MTFPVVEVLEARSGALTVRATTPEGRKIFLHSCYDPEKEARAWATQAEFRPNDHLILFGLGVGHHLRALQSKLGPRNLVYAIEPIPSLAVLQRTNPELREILRKSKAQVVSSWEEFEQKHAEDAQNGWHNIRLLKIAAYSQLCPEAYRVFCQQLYKKLNDLAARKCTLLSSAAVWQENLLRNLKHLDQACPISTVFSALRRHPAIIVGAGPSLEMNVDLLHRAAGKVLIISTGTAARLLYRKGIRPDLIVSVDGNEANYLGHFQDVSFPRSVLVFDPALHHKVLDSHSGPKAILLLLAENRWLEQFYRRPIGLVETGGSGANIAFDLACHLDADPIILIGQDLAFSRGLTHAEGTHAGEIRTFVPDSWLEGNFEQTKRESETNIYIRQHFLGRKRILVEGLDGLPIPTDAKLLAFLHWFEQRIAQLKNERLVIDATEGGARIKGARVQSLKSCLDDHCSSDISELLSTLIGSLEAPARFDKTGLIHFLGSARDQARTIGRRSSQGVQICKEQLESGPSLAQQSLDQLRRIDQKIWSQKDAQSLLGYLFGAALITPRDAGLELECWDLGDVPLKADLYNALTRVVEFSLPLIDEALESLRRRD